MIAIIIVRRFISFFLPRKFKKRREDNSDLAHNDGYSHRRRMRGHRGWHRGKRNNFRRNFHEPGFQQFKVDSESDSDSDSHISLSMFSGLSSLSNSAEEEMCHSNETVETSSSEQNLSKSISNTDENHLNLSYSENNSTDTNIESPVLSNAEKSRGKIFFVCFIVHLVHCYWDFILRKLAKSFPTSKFDVERMECCRLCS